MQLTVLGSGSALPSLTRAHPGYLLRTGGARIVLDTGPGTMARLLAAGVPHQTVTHILYSHNHLDHTGELAPWLFASRVPASGRSDPLTLCGSAGFLGMLEGLRGLYGRWLEAAAYRLDLMGLGAGPAGRVGFDGWALEGAPVAHIDSSLAFRITGSDGRVLVYSGDTDVCESLVELARDADLLLIEASTPDGRKAEGHLTPSEAGRIASAAGARRILLTHFYPECDGVDMLAQLRRTYDGEAALAHDGLTVTV